MAFNVIKEEKEISVIEQDPPVELDELPVPVPVPRGYSSHGRASSSYPSYLMSFGTPDIETTMQCVLTLLD